MYCPTHKTPMTFSYYFGFLCSECIPIKTTTTNNASGF